ncbi:MAG: nicotinamide-nucleotide amidohydrolase family protein [Alistipes inops]
MLERLIPDYFIGYGDATVASATADLLRARRATLAVAESCTGGALSASFSAMAGASDYYLGGVVSYSNDVKVGILGVSPDTLRLHGAVSEQTACEMAEGVRRLCGADYALSTTGVAGPTGGTPEKPVGTVWIGLATPHGTSLQIGLQPACGHRTSNAAPRPLNMLRLELLHRQPTGPQKHTPRMAARKAAMRLPGSEPQRPLRHGNPLCCPSRTDRPTRPNAFRRPAPRPEIIIFRYFKPRCDGLNLQCSNQISLKT